jgi:hypothetical protein
MKGKAKHMVDYVCKNLDLLKETKIGMQPWLEQIARGLMIEMGPK